MRDRDGKSSDICERALKITSSPKAAQFLAFLGGLAGQESSKTIGQKHSFWKRNSAMAKNWIKGAIKHPGALHKELGIPQGKKIPTKTLSKAASSGGILGKRARLAETLKKF